MKSLIVVAHGSRNELANSEAAALVARLEERGLADTVSCSFLELAEPTFQAEAARQVELGATRITILPLFISAGRHVTEDLPREVELARAAHPGATFRVLDYIGSSHHFIASIERFVRSSIDTTTGG